MGGNNLFFEEEKIVKIKNKCITFVVAFAYTISNFVSVGAAVTAKPTTSKIYVNGEQKSCAAYYINGNNYFKLRDLADRKSVV